MRREEKPLPELKIKNRISHCNIKCNKTISGVSGSGSPVTLNYSLTSHRAFPKFLRPGRRLHTSELGRLFLIANYGEWQRHLVNAKAHHLSEKHQSLVLSTSNLETSVNMHNVLAKRCLTIIPHVSRTFCSISRYLRVCEWSMYYIIDYYFNVYTSCGIDFLFPSGTSRFSGQQSDHRGKFWNGPWHGGSHRCRES